MASAADEQRIRKLEDQNDQLRQHVDRLLRVMDAKPKPSAPIIEDDGPRVSYPRTSPIELPSVAEFERLLLIVSRAYPKVMPTFDSENDRREFFLGFCASFERIANMKRTVSVDGELILNAKHDVRYFADEAYRWLCERGTPAETTNGSFFVACIAAGDVAWSLPNRALGISAHLGLGYDGLTASSAAWRRVLATGQPRAPSAGPQPLQQSQRTASVRYL
jgi:hypothetical protein